MKISKLLIALYIIVLIILLICFVNHINYTPEDQFQAAAASKSLYYYGRGIAVNDPIENTIETSKTPDKDFAVFNSCINKCANNVNCSAVSSVLIQNNKERTFKCAQMPWYPDINIDNSCTKDMNCMIYMKDQKLKPPPPKPKKGDSDSTTTIPPGYTVREMNYTKPDIINRQRDKSVTDIATLCNSDEECVGFIYDETNKSARLVSNLGSLSEESDDIRTYVKRVKK